MLAVAATAAEPALALPPIELGGTVSESVRTRKLVSQDRTFTNQLAASVLARSYIWQPWFITVNANADVAWEVERGDQFSAGALAFGGGLSLNILPQSQYPTTISYNHTDSRVDNQITGTDFVRDRVLVNSRASFGDDYRANLVLDYDNLSRPGQGSGVRKQGIFNLSKPIGGQTVGVGFNVTDQGFDSLVDDDTALTSYLGTLNIQSRGASRLYYTSRSFILSSKERDGRILKDRFQAQSFTNGIWRPEGRTYTISGSLRGLIDKIDLTDEADGGTDGGTDARLATAALGLSYPVNARLITNVGVNARYSDIAGAAGRIAGDLPAGARREFVGTVLAGASYNSRTRDLGAYDWRWNANARSELSAGGDDGFEDIESLSAGHAVGREIRLPFLDGARIEGSQTARLFRSPEQGNEVNVTHQVSLSHTDFTPGRQTTLRLLLSDNRDLTGREAEAFQLLQFQLSRQSELAATSLWRANLTVQASRRSRANDGDTLAVSANGTLGYLHNEIFKVRGLSFASDLIMNSVGLETVLFDEERTTSTELFRSEWRNRLEYRVGLLLVGLEASAFQEDGEFGNIVLFRVRRNFGTNMVMPVN